MRVAAIIHNKLPRRFGFWGIVHWTFRGALICAAPATAVWYGSAPLTAAIVAAAVLLALNGGTSVADRLSRADKTPADLQSQTLVRFGDLLSTFKRGGVARHADREMAITACLGIIENFCLPVTKGKEGEIAVTLILYKGTSRTRLRVAQRNPGNKRPTNREVDAERLLGHHVCERGDAPLVVNQISHFGKEFGASPTQTKVDYKSILIIPLRCDDGKRSQVRGFVSIDSHRPYAFYGNRANVIVVMCEPIINQLRELV
jgi:hypothetical protein